jgi:hypothetical protein
MGIGIKNIIQWTLYYFQEITMIQQRKLIRSFLDVPLGHPVCQKPPRLLSGTSSILLVSLDGALENKGVSPLSMKVEI